MYKYRGRFAVLFIKYIMTFIETIFITDKIYHNKKAFLKNLRILHECEARIHNSVPRIARMISVDNFFVFLRLLIFALLLLYVTRCTLWGLRMALSVNSIWKSFLKYE